MVLVKKYFIQLLTLRTGRVPKDFSRYLKSMKSISPRHIKSSSKPTGRRDDFMERTGIERLPAADDILRDSPFKPSEIEL